jgi:hypothetical protein
VAAATGHALYLLYVLAVFVLALEAKVDPAIPAAVGVSSVRAGTLSWGSRIMGLRAIGAIPSFGLRPGVYRQVPSGLLLSFLPTHLTPSYYDI